MKDKNKPDGLDAFFLGMKQLPFMRAPQGLAEDVLRAVRSDKALEAAPSHSFYKPLFAIAAGLIVLFGISLFVRPKTGIPPQTAKNIRFEAEFSDTQTVVLAGDFPALEARIKREWSPGQVAEFNGIIAEIEAKGLSVRPLEDKAWEGLAKNVLPEGILAALNSRKTLLLEMSAGNQKPDDAEMRRNPAPFPAAAGKSSQKAEARLEMEEEKIEKREKSIEKMEKHEKKTERRGKREN